MGWFCVCFYMQIEISVGLFGLVGRMVGRSISMNRWFSQNEMLFQDRFDISWILQKYWIKWNSAYRVRVQ